MRRLSGFTGSGDAIGKTETGGTGALDIKSIEREVLIVENRLFLEKRDKQVWEFVYPEEYYDTLDELEDAIDAMRDWEFAEAEKGFTSLIKRYPYHLDAYHHMALSKYRQGKILQGLPYWESALDFGRSAFSMEFQLGRDRLSWGWIDNRPFLRSLDGMAAAKKDTLSYGSALWLYRECLLLNPDDNLGARYNIGEILLKVGKDREFVDFSSKWGDAGFAEFLYGKVLALFRLGENVKARNALKEAVSYLPLVADELAKKRHVRPRDWDGHSYSLGGEDQAYAYWEDYGALWKKTEGVLDWMRQELKRL